ncbi:MAG: phosphomannose isomerase type II C-terminal cupin domain [Spirochaetes bacterium]|nr:phosphomannose isomerase type II C-terminal cupin domain [Spirochaetota bacterium]
MNICFTIRFLSFAMKNQTDNDSHRPWGFYEILSDEKDHKVKRITVYPEKRLSLQMHEKRAEHWLIVKGMAKMTLNDKDFELTEGQSVDIEKKSSHRIENTGKDNLVFIEVQTGDYFGEDDIIRLDDDYGRV